MRFLQFRTRELTIASIDIHFNKDFGEPFLEFCLTFLEEDEDADTSYSFIAVPPQNSELNMIEGFFKILQCSNSSDMIGHKLIKLQYQTINTWGRNSSGWNCAGYGSSVSDSFIKECGNGTVITRAELEAQIKKTILNKKIDVY